MNKRKQSWLSDKDYNFIYSRAPRVCVDLVVKNQRGVLLTWRAIEPYKNQWHLPGGRLRWRETISRALQRIAREETGLAVEPVKLLGFMEFLREVQAGKKRHTVSMVFLVRPKNLLPAGRGQAPRFDFFKKLPKKTIPIHAKFLRKNNLLT
ncbi:NUDIX domain-containing protein [Patescibacteria group bacterium]|nr:MAG: NUDIX domain-containing protein [Patescibacteria group bacterium]